MVFKSDRQRKAVMAKLGSIQRIRAIKVIQQGKNLLKKDLKKVTTKKEVNLINKRLKQGDKIITRLKIEKPLSNRELRNLNKTSSVIEEKALFGRAGITGPFGTIVGIQRPIKLQKDIREVLNKRARGGK